MIIDSHLDYGEWDYDVGRVYVGIITHQGRLKERPDGLYDAEVAPMSEQE